MNATTDARAVGERIGRAMARDVTAEGMPREWTGLDPQDADRIPAGVDAGRVEEFARHWYKAAVRGECGTLDSEGVEACGLKAGHAGPHKSPWGEF